MRVALIPGDGIGPEVVAEARRVLERVATAHGLELEMETFDLGADRYLRTGDTLPERDFERLRDGFDAILLGALGDPRVPDNAHARDILLGLRFRLDLYVNLRPVRLLHPDHSPLRDVGPGDVDLLLVRENTEGLYTGLGGTLRGGTPQELAVEEDVNTRHGVERVVRAAFELARARGRSRVTLADKANAMRHAGALWRRVFEEVGSGYGDIGREARYVDALAMDLILHPSRYDVIVASNLFGDILSDVAAGLVGGLGLAPSVNYAPGGGALFEPVHGSAPDIAGTDRANPFAAILTAALLLEHAGHQAAADAVRTAIDAAVAAGETTPDLGGRLGTRDAGERVADRIASFHESE
ncbi:MAG TPA: 3-isopropylmalate dehydrogenase [Longimicrobiales bacterium]|nr:3-isopropylmalate dehydrogenase [Longimicrobiales bacterium]